MITLGLYLVATVATASSWNSWSFFIFRFVTGMGIGGEYSAINSAIDELIPARVRGWVDLAINGSWWVGTAAGAALSLVLLNPKIFALDTGWRLAFGLGAIIGLGILLTRRFLPESPRWQMMRGRREEAEGTVSEIEDKVKRSTGKELREPEQTLEIQPRESTGVVAISRTLFSKYPSRTVLGVMLMAAQAFAYNAVFFTYGLVLTTFFKVPPGHIGYFILPFAAGNFLGPLLLGRLFDVLGRRTMITATYGTAGVLLAVTGFLFKSGTLGAVSLTAMWCVIFFFASAGASAAYLTVSEVFPLEIRAMAIAFFFAVGTAIGGISGPILFGVLVGSKSKTETMVGFLIGAGWMIAAAIAELFLGVAAEQRSLEDVAEPLSAEQAKRKSGRRRGGQTWSPRPGRPFDRNREDTDLPRELEELSGAFGKGGEGLSRRELARRAGSRYWGPGRTRSALDEAVRSGRVVRQGNRYSRSSHRG